MLPVILLVFAGQVKSGNAAIQMDAGGTTLTIDAGAGTAVAVGPVLRLGAIDNVETALSRSVAEVGVLETRVTAVTNGLDGLKVQIDTQEATDKDLRQAVHLLNSTMATKVVTDKLRSDLEGAVKLVVYYADQQTKVTDEQKADYETLKAAVAANKEVLDANKLVLDANKLVLDEIQKEKVESANVERFDYFSKSTKVGWANYRGGREWIYVAKVGKMMHCSFHIEGISNSAKFATFTIPYAAANFGSQVDYSSKNVYTYNNVWSDNEAGLLRVASGSKTVKVYRGFHGHNGNRNALLSDNDWECNRCGSSGNTKIIAGSFSLPLA